MLVITLIGKIDNSTEENEQNGKRAIEFAKRIKWMKKY